MSIEDRLELLEQRCAELELKAHGKLKSLDSQIESLSIRMNALDQVAGDAVEIVDLCKNTVRMMLYGVNEKVLALGETRQAQAELRKTDRKLDKVLALLKEMQA